ncbi:MAG: AtpZ/AtpI family protein [Pyrinomonadaceae bacterium]|nr:AtpZ/AtpI family protein [Pyrinomonadaceae bacterium]
MIKSIFEEDETPAKDANAPDDSSIFTALNDSHPTETDQELTPEESGDSDQDSAVPPRQDSQFGEADSREEPTSSTKASLSDEALSKISELEREIAEIERELAASENAGTSEDGAKPVENADSEAAKLDGDTNDAVGYPPEKSKEPEPVVEKLDFVPETKAETIRKSGLAYSAAIALFGSVVFMLILGWFADLLLGIRPWGTVVGIAIGAVIGFMQFFRITSQIIRPRPNNFEKVSLKSAVEESKKVSQSEEVGSDTAESSVKEGDSTPENKTKTGEKESGDNDISDASDGPS